MAPKKAPKKAPVAETAETAGELPAVEGEKPKKKKSSKKGPKNSANRVLDGKADGNVAVAAGNGDDVAPPARSIAEPKAAFAAADAVEAPLNGVDAPEPRTDVGAVEAEPLVAEPAAADAPPTVPVAAPAAEPASLVEATPAAGMGAGDSELPAPVRLSIQIVTGGPGDDALGRTETPATKKKKKVRAGASVILPVAASEGEIVPPDVAAPDDAAPPVGGESDPVPRQKKSLKASRSKAALVGEDSLKKSFKKSFKKKKAGGDDDPPPSTEVTLPGVGGEEPPVLSPGPTITAEPSPVSAPPPAPPPPPKLRSASMTPFDVALHLQMVADSSVASSPPGAGVDRLKRHLARVTLHGEEGDDPTNRARQAAALAKENDPEPLPSLPRLDGPISRPGSGVTAMPSASGSVMSAGQVVAEYHSMMMSHLSFMQRLTASRAAADAASQDATAKALHASAAVLRSQYAAAARDTPPRQQQAALAAQHAALYARAAAGLLPAGLDAPQLQVVLLAQRMQLDHLEATLDAEAQAEAAAQAQAQADAEAAAAAGSTVGEDGHQNARSPPAPSAPSPGAMLPADRRRSFRVGSSGAASPALLPGPPAQPMDYVGVTGALWVGDYGGGLGLTHPPELSVLVASSPSPTPVADRLPPLFSRALSIGGGASPAPPVSPPEIDGLAFAPGLLPPLSPGAVTPLKVPAFLAPERLAASGASPGISASAAAAWSPNDHHGETAAAAERFAHLVGFFPFSGPVGLADGGSAFDNDPTSSPLLMSSRTAPLFPPLVPPAAPVGGDEAAYRGSTIRRHRHHRAATAPITPVTTVAGEPTPPLMPTLPPAAPAPLPSLDWAAVRAQADEDAAVKAGAPPGTSAGDEEDAPSRCNHPPDQARRSDPTRAAAMKAGRARAADEIAAAMAAAVEEEGPPVGVSAPPLLPHAVRHALPPLDTVPSLTRTPSRGGGGGGTDPTKAAASKRGRARAAGAVADAAAEAASDLADHWAQIVASGDGVTPGSGFALVETVSRHSPAALSGLAPLDHIISCGGAVTGVDLPKVVQAAAAAATAVDLVILRGGEVMTLSLQPRTWGGQGLLGCQLLVLESLPTAAPPPPPPSVEAVVETAGAVVDTLVDTSNPPVFDAAPPLPPTFALVEEVRPGSPAAAAGLLAGDTVVSIGGATSGDALPMAVQASIDAPLAVTVLRGSRVVVLMLTPRPWSGTGVLGCRFAIYG